MVVVVAVGGILPDRSSLSLWSDPVPPPAPPLGPNERLLIMGPTHTRTNTKKTLYTKNKQYKSMNADITESIYVCMCKQEWSIIKFLEINIWKLYTQIHCLGWGVTIKATTFHPCLSPRLNQFLTRQTPPPPTPTTPSPNTMTRDLLVLQTIGGETRTLKERECAT